MTRIVVFEDHPLVREGVASLLNGEPDLDVVAYASNGAEACVLVQQLRPDLVLMDISTPAMNAATARIAHSCPDTKVLVLTSFAERDQILDAFDAGACGYLLKDSEPEAVLRAVRSAAQGDTPLDPRVARALIERRRPYACNSLTEREGQVLSVLCEGAANKAIGRKLGITEKTVKEHLTNISAALGVQSRSQAIVWARERVAR